jgi:hypothetical protein
MPAIVGLGYDLRVRDWPDVNYYAEAKGRLIAEILERARAHG